MKSLAALARCRTDGDDPPAALRDHARGRVVNHGINALQVDAHHVVPLAFAQTLNRFVLIIPDARVGDQNVQPAQPLVREFNQLLRLRHFAKVGLK